MSAVCHQPSAVRPQRRRSAWSPETPGAAAAYSLVTRTAADGPPARTQAARAREHARYAPRFFFYRKVFLKRENDDIIPVRLGIQPSNDIPVPYYRSVKYDLQLCTLECVRTQLQTAVCSSISDRSTAVLYFWLWQNKLITRARPRRVVFAARVRGFQFS